MRTALIRGHLDRRMLVDHDPSDLLTLLAPDDRSHARRAVTKGYLGVRLAPGVRLAATPPRVRGSMTVRAARDDVGRRVLSVVANYVWVYPFVKARQPVVLHDRIDWRFYPASADIAPSSVGVWAQDASSYTSGMDCAAAQRNLLKPQPAVDPSADPVAAGDDPDALYDPKHGMRITETCR